MSQTEPAATNPARKWRFDVIGWLGVLIGVAGLATGYIYYVRTLSYPEITWWSTDQIVFNSQNVNPNIKVIDRSGNQIQHNVYALNISVSNTGTALLERTNDINSLVRSPLTISLLPFNDAGERVLSASVVAFSEKKPVNLICTVGDGGALTFSWDHLDPSSGFRMLLLYTASQQLTPHLNVSVVGMNNLNHLDLTPRMTEVPEVPATDNLFPILAMFVWVAGLILLIITVMSVISWIGEKLRIGATVEEFTERSLIPFFKRHSSAIQNTVVLIIKAIGYAFFPAAILVALVLVFFYQSTLIAFWHYAVPSKQPVAIESTVTNMPCVQL
jgi:hypothetical protein